MGSAVTDVVKGSINDNTVSDVNAALASGDPTEAVKNAAAAAAAGQASIAAAEAKSAASAASYQGNSDIDSAVAILKQSIGYDGLNDEQKEAVNGLINRIITGSYQYGYGNGYGTAYAKGYGKGYADEYQNYLTQFNDYTNALTAGFSGDEFTGKITDVASAYAGAGASVTLGKVGETMDSFSTQLDTLKAGTQSLADGSATLTSGLGSLKTGAGTLASGTSTLVEGTNTLESGASSLSAGAAALSSGTETLQSGALQLKSGADTLSSNSEALNDGASKLQTATDTIISKLKNKEGGIDEFISNLNGVRRAARDYNSFAGVADGKTAKTKFIIKIDGVGENID